MALVAERWGLIPELQQFAQAGKPVWGTCAGLIFLANKATGGLKLGLGWGVARELQPLCAGDFCFLGLL
jgi:glutamine amidotransferase PdxT